MNKLIVLAVAAAGLVAAGALLAQPSAASRPASGPATRPSSEPTDWFQYRGRDRNGISPQTDWTHEWPKDGPRVAWKAEVGDGYSSVTVAGGRAYTMGAKDDTDTVWCLDAAKGDVIWKYEYKAKAGQYKGPRCSPTIDGDAIYTFSRDGLALRLSADKGEKVWELDTCKELGTKPLMWGMSGSPLVEGDLLLMTAGTCGIAVEKKTGKIVWKVESQIAGYASPVAIDIDGKRCALLTSGTEIVCVTVADGKVLWRHPWKPPTYTNNCVDPIVSGELVFLSSGYDAGGSVIKATADKAETVWKNGNMGTMFATAVLIDGFIYGFDGDMRGTKVALRCVDLAKGEVKWTQPMLGLLIASGDRLIIQTTDGDLVVASATPTAYKELARAKVLTGKSWTMPTISGGRIYCRNEQGSVVCLDVGK